ncbi:MAG: hypothetical protein IKA57_07425 [Clostridia bacterium]|nr:hypothetical protein [Clostridia bacterium]
MRFANSIRLLMEDFKHAFKLLLYRAVMTLIVIALCSAFVLPELMEIAEADVTKTLIHNFKNIFLSFVGHDTTSPSEYVKMVFGENGNLKQLFDYIISMRLELILVCIGCVLVYLLKRYVDTLVYFAMGSIINDKMATYTDTPFFTTFIANLGKASKYALLYVPVVFLFDVGTLSLCFVLLHFLPLLAALFLSVTLIVALQSLKLTFTSQWMPAMTTDGKRLGEAIHTTNKREKRQVGKTYCLYVVTVYLIIILNAMAAVFTFGSALLLTIPTSYLLLICEQYVNYYTMKGKKYFITYDTIATNPDYGDSEHFFEYIEEMEKEEEKVVTEQENE